MIPFSSNLLTNNRLSVLFSWVSQTMALHCTFCRICVLTVWLGSVIVITLKLKYLFMGENWTKMRWKELDPLLSFIILLLEMRLFCFERITLNSALHPSWTFYYYVFFCKSTWVLQILFSTLFTLIYLFNSWCLYIHISQCGIHQGHMC